MFTVFLMIWRAPRSTVIPCATLFRFVLFAGAVPIVGACVSTAVIVCVTVAEWLPQASVASHERRSAEGRVVKEGRSRRMLNDSKLQSSDALGGVNDGVAVQSIVLFAGTVPIVGACVSTA